MFSTPTRVFLDTNVYLIGIADPGSPDAKILTWVGFGQDAAPSVEVVVSNELFQQMLRVTKCLRNKDWGGEILSRIWQNLRLRYVLLNENDYYEIEGSGVIPREDIGVYLTARDGGAQCFISSNHKLIRILAKNSGDFECMTSAEFVEKYLREE